MKYIKAKCVALICGQWVIELLSTMSNHHRLLPKSLKRMKKIAFLGWRVTATTMLVNIPKPSITIKVIPQITDSLDLHARGSPNPYRDLIDNFQLFASTAGSKGK